MLLGLSLFYVGAVLILNGLWMLGRIGDREITIINLFTGGLTLLVDARGRYFVEDREALRTDVDSLKQAIAELDALRVDFVREDEPVAGSDTVVDAMAAKLRGLDALAVAG